MDPVHALTKLAEIGSYGVNFHDDDLIPFGSDDATRDGIVERFKKGLAETGLVVTTATTNLFTHPVFKSGALTNNDREIRRFALRKVIRNIDLAAELGAKVYVCWGGREGAEYGASQGTAEALDRYQEAFNLLGEYVTEAGYDMRFAIEPKPNEPRGDILLPTIGHALAFIETLDRPELVGVNPEIGHEEMAGVNAAAGYAQALWQGKLFHIDLNGQNGPRYDQDLRFGAGNVRGAFWVVDTLLAGGYDGPVHFDFKPARTEGEDGVWASAKACIDNYLILREKAKAFRADPEVQAALEAAKVPSSPCPPWPRGRGGDSCSTRPRRTPRRWPSAAARSRRSTSSRWSTSTACADPRPDRDRAVTDPFAGPAGAEQVRRRNTATVLRSLREAGPASRVELAARTGLAKATVGTIVGALEEGEVVRLHEQVRSGDRGRPASRVTLAGSRPVGIGLEINVEHVAAVAVDLGGGVRLRRTRAVPRPEEASRLLVQVAEEVAGLLAEHGLRAVGATVAVPGLIEADERTVAWTPNLPLAEASLAEQVDAVFGWRRRVRISNDADCGALAELHHGAGRGSRHLLYLTGDVGIGAGVVADARLMRGASGFAGEVGHLPLGASEARCGCGRHGCWEASVGLHALLERVGLPRTGTAAGTAAAVADRARTDAAARAGIADLGRWLGHGLGVVCGVLDPGLVVLGGYFQPLGVLVLDPARAALAATVASPAQPVPELRVGELGPEAAALGAAERAVADVLDGSTEIDLAEPASPA